MRINYNGIHKNNKQTTDRQINKQTTNMHTCRQAYTQGETHTKLKTWCIICGFRYNLWLYIEDATEIKRCRALFNVTFCKYPLILP